MNTLTYFAGKPNRRMSIDAVIDTLAESLLNDGDVDKALQRAFRLGSEDEMGLLDVLDRLREEASDLQHELREQDQHGDPGSAEKRLSDNQAMRDALRQVESLDDLQGIDPDLMDRALTTEERDWIDQWSNITGELIESGLVVQQGTKLKLTARAIRRIGSGLIRHMYLPPQIRGRGAHALPRPGLIGSPGDTTTDWEWGRPLDLDVAQTLISSIRHGSDNDHIRLQPDDFVVKEREAGAAYATVLMLDMSRSMFESGTWDIAKRAAFALDALNATQHKQDHLDLVGFSGDARKLAMTELPSLSWDQFSHGTNLHAGLIVARRLLERRRNTNRQMVIVTDGEPTAFMEGEQPIFEHPVTERTLHATLLEARRAAKANIAVTIIAVGDELRVEGFVGQLARITRGRLIHLPADQLGSFVVHDIANGRIGTVR